ncbi:CoA-binding protein [Pseudoroseomonas wenyumeiae]|uniref:CoA-binding protein n=2 Tax=Teichococcus wenyumeiae TaxID=2478470 RepID=A0A3A9JDL2_9PROT|nr:CoA-binding protein [Pseudoroseomonas wenyumeiae]RMI17380.1 CoA-binding protein [Pseudoroseomonas wenyumeiae]
MAPLPAAAACHAPEDAPPPLPRNAPGSRLAGALAPASIAVLGASDNPHKAGGRPIAFMRQYGFQGRVYPVNPARAEVQGLRSYASLAELPEVPELVIVAVGGAEGLRLVEQCAAAGVGTVVVVASGYAEAGAEGEALQARMVAACRAGGTRLVGPNCQGLANFSNGSIANFSTIFHEQPGRDGPLAIIGQSGATTQAVYALAQARGIHARYVHATGNEADVTAAELLLETVEDTEVRAVLLYVEALSDPETLACAAARAAERGIAVIGVKSGRTANGQRAASSHTGAMATEDRVIDAFFERHNIIRAVDPYEAVSVAALCIGTPLPQGNNLVVMSNSGASCVMGADTADELGMPLLPFGPDTARQLAQVMPAFSSASNPIDLTGALLTDRALFPGVLDVLSGVEDIHLLMVSFPVAGSGYDVEGYADALARFAAGRRIALAVSAYQEPVREAFSRRGLVVFGREREALQALQTYAAHAERRRRLAARPVAAPQPVPGPPAIAGTLDEAQSLQYLRDAGLETIPFALCRDAGAAVEAAARLGGPVVLKGCSPDILHKSEHGLVALGLETPEQIREAASRHAETIRTLGARYSGALVARMLKGGRELALGARLDPVFGPVVLVGDGGIYLEALRDFRLLVPPFTEADVAEALARLRIAPLLGGLRGEPPADVAAFCRMAARLGEVMSRAEGRIASADINPVKVMAAGQGAYALDAVIELAAGEPPGR